MAKLSNTEQIPSKLKLQGETSMDFKKKSMGTKETVALNHCDKDCPSFDLCKKRILIIGGITRMESLYRDMIEGHGGFFEYHNGYVKKGPNGAKRLESRLAKSDIIICPVNCNSHAACIMVKNLCKKHKKKVHMLSSFGLSSVSRIIQGTNTRVEALN
jgi:hypothetical protein